MVWFTTLSDTHTHELDLQSTVTYFNGNTVQIDFGIIAGDISYTGMKDLKALRKVNDWFGRESKKFKYGLFWTQGNHEIGVTKTSLLSQNLTHLANGLKSDELVNICGLKIWFSPWSPVFGNWAYMLFESELRKKYANMPEGIDVLVSHSPPRNVLDDIEDQGGLRVGSIALEDRLYEMDLPPKVVICGHLHRWEHQDRSQSMISKGKNIRCYNVSICDDSYKAVNSPIIFDTTSFEDLYHNV